MQGRQAIERACLHASRLQQRRLLRLSQRRPSPATLQEMLGTNHRPQCSVAATTSSGTEGVGWKTVGQEYLPPAELHRWVLSGYASFLMATARNGALTLGIHPFAYAVVSDCCPPIRPLDPIWVAYATASSDLTFTRNCVHGRPAVPGVSIFNATKSVQRLRLGGGHGVQVC